MDSYKLLLQPLKDLAQNFNIDISESLDEYLDALTEIATNETNFTEAALVVQGSAVVFSKKVDFLHQLVLQVVDSMGTSKFDQNLSKTSSREEGVPIDELTSFENTIVLHDDVLRRIYVKSGNINLPRKTYREKHFKRGPTSRLSTATSAINSSVISAALVQSVLGDNKFSVESGAVDVTTGGLLIPPMDSLHMNSSMHERSAAYLSRRSMANESPHVMMPADAGPDGQHMLHSETEQNSSAVHDPEAYFDDVCDLSISPIGKSSPGIISCRESLARSMNPPRKSLLDPFERLERSRPIKVGKTYLLPSDSDKLPLAKAWTEDPLLALSNVEALGYVREAQLRNRLKAIEKVFKTKNNGNIGFVSPKDHERGVCGINSNEGDDPIVDADSDEVFEDASQGMEAWEPTFSPTLAETDIQSSLEVDDSAASPSSYEAMCKAHLEAFMKEAQEFSKDSEISSRVNAWARQLEPILQAEAVCQPFDLSSYCKRTVDYLVHAEEEGVQFHALVSGSSSAEVGRVFLSCLQLVNNGLLAIDGSHRTSPDDFAFQVSLSSSKLTKPVINCI